MDVSGGPAGTGAADRLPGYPDIRVQRGHAAIALEVARVRPETARRTPNGAAPAAPIGCETGAASQVRRRDARCLGRGPRARPEDQGLEMASAELAPSVRLALLDLH